jgi:hypothetical protein
MPSLLSVKSSIFITTIQSYVGDEFEFRLHVVDYNEHSEVLLPSSGRLATAIHVIWAL